MNSTATISNATSTITNATNDAWQVPYEQSLNGAVFAGAVAWGIHTFVFIRCLYAIDSKWVMASLKWLPVACTLFATATTNVFCSFKFNELAWIQQRDYPGGPIAFFAEQQSHPLHVATVGSATIALISSYAFMIYRNHSLWNKRFFTIIMSLSLLLDSVDAFRNFVKLGGTPPWDGVSRDFTKPAYSLLVFPQMFLCLSLLSRELYLCKRSKWDLIVVVRGDSETMMEYNERYPFWIESAIPLWLLTVVATFVRVKGTTASPVTISLFVQVAPTMAELMITHIVRDSGSPQESLAL